MGNMEGAGLRLSLSFHSPGQLSREERRTFRGEKVVILPYGQFFCTQIPFIRQDPDVLKTMPNCDKYMQEIQCIKQGKL